MIASDSAFSRLPTEILANISSILQRSHSYGSLSSFGRTSNYYNTITTPYLYRHIEITEIHLSRMLYSISTHDKQTSPDGPWPIDYPNYPTNLRYTHQITLRKCDYPRTIEVITETWGFLNDVRSDIWSKSPFIELHTLVLKIQSKDQWAPSFIRSIELLGQVVTRGIKHLYVIFEDTQESAILVQDNSEWIKWIAPFSNHSTKVYIQHTQFSSFPLYHRQFHYETTNVESPYMQDQLEEGILKATFDRSMIRVVKSKPADSRLTNSLIIEIPKAPSDYRDTKVMPFVLEAKASIDRFQYDGMDPKLAHRWLDNIQWVCGEDVVKEEEGCSICEGESEVSS
ncbi:hypothetical protein I204_00098 [Kwoniella mangroviensis CBS 8886]|nr:hypothetical protein I204_00098 [Kwoniella mangroviensis CBS 8886]